VLRQVNVILSGDFLQELSRYRRALREDSERCGFPGCGFSVAGSRGKGLGAVIELGVLESVVCKHRMFMWGPVVGFKKYR